MGYHGIPWYIIIVYGSIDYYTVYGYSIMDPWYTYIINNVYNLYIPWYTMVYRVLQKKQPSCQTHCEETCMPPSPNSMLLPRFAWKSIQKKQPCRFGCRHALGNNTDQGGAGGSGVMWQHVGGWLLKKKRGSLFGLWMCKHKTWTDSLLHLPRRQSKHAFIFNTATHQTKTQQICFIWFMDAQTQAWTNSLLHVPKPQSKHTFIFTYIYLFNDIP